MKWPGYRHSCSFANVYRIRLQYLSCPFSVPFRRCSSHRKHIPVFWITTSFLRYSYPSRYKVYILIFCRARCPGNCPGWQLLRRQPVPFPHQSLRFLSDKRLQSPEQRGNRSSCPFRCRRSSIPADVRSVRRKR